MDKDREREYKELEEKKRVAREKTKKRKKLKTSGRKLRR